MAHFGEVYSQCGSVLTFYKRIPKFPFRGAHKEISYCGSFHVHGSIYGRLLCGGEFRSSGGYMRCWYPPGLISYPGDERRSVYICMCSTMPLV